MSVSVTNKVSDWRLHMNLGGRELVQGQVLTGTPDGDRSPVYDLWRAMAGEGLPGASGLPSGALRPG